MMTTDQFIEEITPEEVEIVHAYADFFNKNNLKDIDVLEIGSGWGLFARSFLDSTTGFLTTIDKKGDLPTFEKYTEGFQDRIERLVGSSADILEEFESNGVEFDVVFVDGSHVYEDVLKDLDLALVLTKKGGFILVDDCGHPENFKNLEDGSLHYGVTKALVEMEVDFEYKAVGHGLAIIKKNI